MYSARPWSHRPTDAAFFVYFALHIVASLCMDFQGILPHWYPESLARLAAWYANTFGDFLMARVATDPSLRWFATFIWAELLVQLPVFFFACWQLWHGTLYILS
ncbi:transmembrane protein 6/97 [Blastocladiella britannica]|nr:transmembrane protein 6/97 [Blastocladiella britannica]